MKLQLIITSQADEDMHEVWLYILPKNMRSADAIVDRFNALFLTLCDQPFMGRARPEFGEDIRSFPMKNYIILYRPTPTTIEIIRVLNAALDVDETFTPN